MGQTGTHPGLLDRHTAAEAAKKAFLLAILVHLFALVAMPDYNIRIRVARDLAIEPIDLPPELAVPVKQTPVIPRPTIPVEADDDAAVPDDATIEPTILDPHVAALMPFEPVQELPAPNQFVAYDTKPDFIRYVTPDYPEMARKAGIEGTVLAQILVGINGRVRDLRIVSGPGIFHDSVRAAALASLLSPAKQRDKPVAVWIAVPYRFVLRDAP